MARLMEDREGLLPRSNCDRNSDHQQIKPLQQHVVAEQRSCELREVRFADVRRKGAEQSLFRTALDFEQQ